MKGWLLPGLAAMLLSGCGATAERGEVDGQVRRQGKPLPNVVVTFVPDVAAPAGTPKASGVTSADGKFRLRGEDLENTVAAGLYRVIVEDLAVYSAPRAPDGTVLKAPPARFPAKYRDLLKTPLEHHVRAGAQSVELDLTD